MADQQARDERDGTAADPVAGSGAGAPVRSRPAVVVLAGLALLVVYVGLSFLNDTKGTLSTDVGGKIATLEVMQEKGTATPGVGYWAAEWDPDATVHGLYYTSVVDGTFVNVTTVPVIELARPLFAVAGYRGALLWSMLGAVAAAFAARALALRAGADEQRGWLAFGLIGLASPALLYALDLWEHAPGLGLMAWGVVAMVDTAAGRARWTALAAGLAFGAAFSMRTEAAAYGFVVVASAASCSGGGGASCGRSWPGRSPPSASSPWSRPTTCSRWRCSARRCAPAGPRARRRAAAPTSACGSRRPSPPPSGCSRAPPPTSCSSARWRCCCWPGRCGGRSRPGDPRVARIAAVGAVLLFLLRAVDGLGFVPGFLVTAPFGVVALVLATDRRVAQAGP